MMRQNQISRIAIVLFICAMFISSGCIERKPERLARKESPVKAELLAMVADEKDLQTDTTLSASEIATRERSHRQRVLQLLAAALIEEGEDLYRSALILHRGDEPTACLLSHYMALEADRKGYKGSRFLAATALDRYLVLLGLPQRFGTQSLILKSGIRELYPVDSAVSDSERLDWDIPPLDSLKMFPDNELWDSANIPE